MSPITGGPAGEWPTRSRVLDADPDTPTTCSLCESGGRVFHVHPKAAPHPDAPTTEQWSEPVTTACGLGHHEQCSGTGARPEARIVTYRCACPCHRDTDPDTPTADAPATCNSGTGGGETCALPRGHSGPHDPDAPHLDFSPENMARLREAALQNYVDTADAPADTDLHRHSWEPIPGVWVCSTCGLASTGVSGRDWVAADEVRAQVEAARRDAHADLWTWGDVLKAKAEARRDALNEAADEWPAFQLRPSECRDLLRDRAARGETRQP